MGNKEQYIILITESWKAKSMLYVCQNFEQACDFFRLKKEEFQRQYPENMVLANCKDLYQMQFHPNGNKLLICTIRIEIVKPEILN